MRSNHCRFYARHHICYNVVDWFARCGDTSIQNFETWRPYPLGEITALTQISEDGQKGGNGNRKASETKKGGKL